MFNLYSVGFISASEIEELYYNVTYICHFVGRSRRFVCVHVCMCSAQFDMLCFNLTNFYIHFECFTSSNLLLAALVPFSYPTDVCLFGFWLYSEGPPPRIFAQSSIAQRHFTNEQ